MGKSNIKPNLLLQSLESSKVLIFDGGTGTYLQVKGLEPGGCPEQLNVTRPELIKTMASQYFESGSDLVMTNTFGGNRFMLEKYQLGEHVEEFNRAAAELATSAATPGKYVIGSIGPTGEFLAPLGNVTETVMLDAFKEQVSALASGGVDGIIIETMTSIEEASLAIKAARENTSLPVMATMTFDKGPRGLFTMMGVTPHQAAIQLQNAGANVVGSNCGNGIEVMVQIAREMREATDGLLVINSNAGIPELIKGKVVYTETPEFLASFWDDLIKIGVDIIGGCCGTTPLHIKALANSRG